MGKAVSYNRAKEFYITSCADFHLNLANFKYFSTSRHRHLRFASRRFEVAKLRVLLLKFGLIATNIK